MTNLGFLAIGPKDCLYWPPVMCIFVENALACLPNYFPQQTSYTKSVLLIR